MNSLMAHLPQRGIVCISGEDAGNFLQNIITIDVLEMPYDTLHYGGFLTPQGKIIFDFFVERKEGGANREPVPCFLFDLPEEDTEDFIERLSFYRLHARVSFTRLSQDVQVVALWQEEVGSMEERLSSEYALPFPTARENAFFKPDSRLPALGWRAFLSKEQLSAFENLQNCQFCDETLYEAHRIRHTIPQSGTDFTGEDIYPHNIWMEKLNGIDFKKGCYIGQEVISRMAHKHVIRRRFLRVVSDTNASLRSETPVIACGRVLGKVGSVSASEGLGLIRLDHWQKACDAGHPVTCDDLPVTLHFPEWADVNKL